MEALMCDLLAALRHAECAVDEFEPHTSEYAAAIAAQTRLHALYHKALWEGLSEATRRDVREALAELQLPRLDEAAWAARC